MTKNRTPLESAIGQLILALQREWNRHAGEGEIWTETEVVMCRGHDLLQHAKIGGLGELLNGTSIEEFLGHAWVTRHPQIRHFIREIEKLPL